MKKVSTLALALIAMGSLAVPASAQEAVTFNPVSDATLETGWYQMRQVVGVSRNDISADAPRYVYSSDALGQNYTWFGTDGAQKTDATAFVYVHKNGSNYAIMNINGKWGSNVAKYTDGNAEPAYEITQDASNTNQYKVGATWDDWKGWNYMGGSSNAANQAARFQFSKVSEETLASYDIYSIEFTGDATTGTLTSNNDANKGTKTVYPGGKFFFTAGTTLTSADFTASDATNCSSSIAVDATNKKVTVTYSYSYTGFKSYINEAKSVLASTRIGYPVETSTAYATLQTAITTAEAVTEANYTREAYITLQNAVLAYKLSDDNVRLPEDGKAYTITAVSKAGKKSYMNYAESGYSLVSTSGADNSSYPVTAKFVCHKTSDGKYVFVNNAGKYLTFKGGYNTGINGNKGYVDSYGQYTYQYYKGGTLTTSDACYPQLLTLAKMVEGTKVSGLTDGFLYVKGTRGNVGSTTQDGSTPNDVNFVIKNVTGYDAANVPFFDDTFSSALLFEETTYPNIAKFNAVSDVEGVSHLATFSAPFATVVPADVTAYYVSKADGEKATMKAITEGEAIPANTGVILASTTGAEATMIPATTETVATVENNQLGNSAGADKTLAEGDNAYILANGTDGTAFYKGKVGTTLKANKAYLTYATGGSAIALNFGGNVTGINTAIKADSNDNAPVYDLAGRRVVRTVKGGLYIKGGNKFLAK